MSGIREKNTRLGLLIELLKRAMIAAAIVCLLALTVEWLVDRSAKAVLAEAVDTPMPTSAATLPPATVSPTPLSSPTWKPTESATVSPTPTATLAVPFHVVEDGETLARIARRYGVSIEELVLVNDLTNPDLLYVGQRLALPSATTIPSTPEPSPTAIPSEPTPVPPLPSADDLFEGRWIDVDISEQRLTAYEDDMPVRTTLVSTGLPNTPTPLGQFHIWIKLRYDDMAGADYYIEDVPYVMYFHQGYGLHGVTWHGNFGHPMSHGCVNLPTPEAEWLFNWSDVGTLVTIHE